MRDTDVEGRTAGGPGGSAGRAATGIGPKRLVSARRRALPSGRAALGALLVTAAATGAFVVASSDDARTPEPFVVASRPIAVGDVIDRADLAVVELDVPDDFAARGFATAAELEGMTATAPLGVGDPVLRSAVTQKLAAQTQEISFPIADGRGAGGLVGPNDRVNLFVTWELVGNKPRTELLLADAQVVRVNRPPDQLDRAGRYELVVALDRPEESARLVHAIDQGRLSVIRTTDDRKVPKATGFPNAVAPQ